MSEPLENLYFNWLYSKVCDVRAREARRRYEHLLGELHRTEFVWLLSGDDNRAEDGRELRDEFLREARLSADEDWMDLGCSVLEMLVAFSRRLGFQTSEPTSAWFWIMLENLGLSEFSDANDPGPSHTIKDILEQFVWRTYDSAGRGGLFPLRDGITDQREVELWYQFNEYIHENKMV